MTDIQKEYNKLKEQFNFVSSLVNKTQTPVTDEKDPDAKAIENCVSIIVLGASGDLATKMTYPALFSLFCLKLLPKKTTIFGFARSEMSDDKFKEHISKNFPQDWKDKREDFFKICKYFQGKYDEESFAKLNKELEKHEDDNASRVFYYAIPPDSFVESSQFIKKCCQAKNSTRIIVEKPYGRDLTTANQLSAELAKLFKEPQLYRIDHYLGKEGVQNILALRFANTAHEPLWNRHYIQSVLIDFKEEFGAEGRGKYFDKYGMIRDVMQNHLLQVMALIAMEPPASIDAEDISAEKVKVLRSMKADLSDIVIGQYVADKTGKHKGYKDDETVNKNSKIETFATIVIFVNNDRWAGVPFIMRCGKALEKRVTEVRIQMKEPKFPVFPGTARNEFVIRVTPEEKIMFKMTNKIPGLECKLGGAELDMSFKDTFKERIPKPYERLLYDVLQGDHSVFPRKSEIEESWKVFDPLLAKVEKMDPIPYEYGSTGPAEASKLIEKYDFKEHQKFQWPKSKL